MGQKAKFIIIGLIGAIFIFAFISLNQMTEKKKLEAEIERFQRENATLEQKVQEKIAENKNLDQRLVSVTNDLQKLSQERSEWQKKYDLVSKARDELAEQIKSLRAKAESADAQKQQQQTRFEESYTGDEYWANIVKAKKELELKLNSLKDELRTTQINNEQLTREKANFELEVANIAREKENIERELEYAEKQLASSKKLADSLSLELVQEKNDKRRLQDSFGSMKKEHDIMRTQLKSLTDKKMSLEKKTAELQNKNSELLNKFTELDIMLKDKISQIDSLRERFTFDEDVKPQAVQPQRAAVAKESVPGAVQLPPIVVRPNSSSAQTSSPAYSSRPSSGLSGKVLAVNKDHNFVIVDLGEEAGVKTGNTFQIYRDGKIIGLVEAIQVRQAISACDIRNQTSTIRAGDTVQ